jgi:hypothetical protein
VSARNVGAPVALHADHVQAGLGGGEFSGAVRRDGSAGVDIGVDQRGELARRLQDGIQVETDLGQQGQVGPEAGQDNHLVDVVEDLAALGGAHRRCPLHQRLARDRDLVEP